jgi:hypothetical protein
MKDVYLLHLKTPPNQAGNENIALLGCYADVVKLAERIKKSYYSRHINDSIVQLVTLFTADYDGYEIYYIGPFVIYRRPLI